jgi:hypothetical protein
MTTKDHQHYAGWSSRRLAPGVAHIHEPPERKGPAHSFALPHYWSADQFNILILPAALGLVGVLGAILCSLLHWN